VRTASNTPNPPLSDLLLLVSRLELGYVYTAALLTESYLILEVLI